jgi:hypothetical protein
MRHNNVNFNDKRALFITMWTLEAVHRRRRRRPVGPN